MKRGNQIQIKEENTTYIDSNNYLKNKSIRKHFAPLLSARRWTIFLAVATLPASPQACAMSTFNEYGNGMERGWAPVG